MIQDKKVLALIPARGGSKGLPKKNIKYIAGKPLITWSIEEGRKSKYVDYVLVSTDSEEIAEVAKNSGAEVPFLRPAELALDTSPSIDAIIHAVDWAEMHKEKFDYLVLLEPTSPLRDAKDIDTALEMLVLHNTADSIVGVCKVESAHPAFLSKIQDSLLVPFMPSFEVKRRQDIEDYYFFEGSVYISKIEVLRKKRTFYHDKTLPYIVPKWKALEIDDIIDFILIEKLLELKQQKSELLI